MFPQDHLHSTLSIRQVGNLPSSIHGQTSEIERLRFSPDGCFLAVITEWDKIVLIWDVPSQTLLRKLTFATRISDLAFSPDGTRLAIAAEGAVTLWDVTGMHCLERVPIHVSEVIFSPSGKELLLVASPEVASFWDLANQRMISSFQAVPEGSGCGWWVISTGLPCLAVVTDAGKAFLWLFESAEGEAVPLTTITTNGNDGVAFSPDGTLLACIATPRKQPHIQIYDIQEQAYKMDLVSPTPFIGTDRSQSLAFSPDGTFLVVADIYGTLFFWDISKQQLITTITAHPNPGNLPYYGIRALAWSPASQCLATGGWEQRDPSFSGERFTIKLWKIEQV